MYDGDFSTKGECCEDDLRARLCKGGVNITGGENVAEGAEGTATVAGRPRHLLRFGGVCAPVDMLVADHGRGRGLMMSVKINSYLAKTRADGRQVRVKCWRCEVMGGRVM